MTLENIRNVDFQNHIFTIIFKDKTTFPHLLFGSICEPFENSLFCIFHYKFGEQHNQIRMLNEIRNEIELMKRLEQDTMKHGDGYDKNKWPTCEKA
jgi:hypothetical protein